MRILVIGANGQVGQQIVGQLQDTEHEPVAMVRREIQVKEHESKGVTTVLADLEKDFSHAFENIDTVIFAAGSGGSTGADKTILIDQEAAIEAIDIAKNKGIKHFALLSAIGAENPKESNDDIKHYMSAKHRTDEHLKASGVPYTIVRPGLLSNEPGTGKVNLSETEIESKNIPREDVAAVFTHIMERNHPEGKVYNLVEGNTPIEETL